MVKQCLRVGGQIDGLGGALKMKSNLVAFGRIWSNAPGFNHGWTQIGTDKEPDTNFTELARTRSAVHNGLFIFWSY